MSITKKSLIRKISIFSLVVLIFVSSLFGSTVNTASAVGVDTVIKLTGGKAVVRALAEKAGMQLSKKQVDNVAGYIQKQTYDGDPKAIEFANKINALSPIGESSKTGFQKYLLDPALWLSGLDIILLAVNAFQDGYDNTVPVPMFSQCQKPMYKDDGTLINPGVFYFIVQSNSALDQNMYVFFGEHTQDIYYYQGVANGYTFTSSDYVQTYSRANTSLGWKAGTYSKPFAVNITSISNKTITYSDTEMLCDYEPKEEDIISVTNVDNSVINNFDNDTYNTNTTYNIEIDIPDTVNYDDPTPWNESDPNIPNEVNPAPKDSDGDGVPDETDSNADGDGFLENLLGIIALIAIFDLLKAVIFYLARMFEFILTIPLIEAIPIDNVAFEWFRTTEIIGVQIYSVVSLLATVGLSFAVYKVVRRLLP